MLLLKFFNHPKWYKNETGWIAVIRGINPEPFKRLLKISYCSLDFVAVYVNGTFSTQLNLDILQKKSIKFLKKSSVLPKSSACWEPVV